MTRQKSLCCVTDQYNTIYLIDFVTGQQQSNGNSHAISIVEKQSGVCGSNIPAGASTPTSIHSTNTQLNRKTYLRIQNGCSSLGHHVQLLNARGHVARGS